MVCLLCLHGVCSVLLAVSISPAAIELAARTAFCDRWFAISVVEPDCRPGNRPSAAVGCVHKMKPYHPCHHEAPHSPARTAAHRQLALISNRLFADASESCRRDGIAPTDTELCTRVGWRIGLSAHEVARSLGHVNGATPTLHSRLELAAEARARGEGLDVAVNSPKRDIMALSDRTVARQRIMALVGEVLGERERQVFLARCTGGGEAVPLATVAVRVGVSRDRVTALEASARRKIATALANESATAHARGTE